MQAVEPTNIQRRSMQIKELFEKVRNTQGIIKALEDQLAETRQNAMRMTRLYDQERVQGGGQSDRIGDTLAQLEAYEQQLSEEISWRCALRAEALEALGQLKDTRYIRVLVERYLNDQPWHCVAQRMGYEERWVYALHRQAFAALEAAGIQHDADIKN